MTEDWKTYKLSELIDVNSNQLKKGDWDWINYIDIKSVGTGYYEKPLKLDFDKAPSRARRILQNGNTVISSVRPNLKSFFYCRDIPENAIASTGFAVLNAKNIDSRFLYYLTTNDNYINYLVQSCSGSAYPAFSPKVILDSKVTIPPRPEQRAIASILSALDDKIELNLQMNKTLEEMAMALYKHWFVDFGPFQNGKFINSELGMIPEGWEVTKFGNLIQKVIDNRGKTPPLSNIKTDYLLFETYQLTRDTLFPKSFQENKAKYITEDIYNSRKWFRKGHPEFMDILFATVGNGIPNWSFMSENDGVGIAQNVVAIRSKSNIPSEFLRYSFESNSFLDQFDGYVITTAQPSIKLSDLNMVNMILPPNEILNNWHNIVDDYIKQVYSNFKENETLTTLRDTLLPKLISGEVRVKDVEKLVHESL